MFEELMAKIRRRQAEFDFEMSRCEDVYRLERLLCQFQRDMTYLWLNAEGMVKELEEV